MLKRLFGLVFQELPSIEEAAAITRDRALQGRQDAIDVIKRTLAQMENNPVALQLQEVLSEILDSPSLITDEIFNNIMSKTGEVLDATYDAEVGQLLDAARARGITGPALQTQIQRAKEAKSAALANAYRDAIIARAQEGKQTQLEAVNAGNSLLSNLFNQKRVLTEDLANVLQSVVEEPFVNPGPTSLPQAPSPGGAGGGGGGSQIGYDFSGTFMDQPLGQRGLTTTGDEGYFAERGRFNEANQRPPLTNAERFGSTEQLRQIQQQLEQQRAAMTPEQKQADFDRQQQILRDQGVQPFPEPGTGTVDFTKAAVESLQKAGLATGSEGAEGLAGQVSPLQSPTSAGQLTFGGQQFGLQPGVQIKQTPMDSFRQGLETTIQAPGQAPLVFGGGAGETQRAADLSKQFGMENLIGTSEGAGVRMGTIPGLTAEQENALSPAERDKIKAAVARGESGDYTVGGTGGKKGYLVHWGATTPNAPTRKGSDLLKKLADTGGGAGTTISTSSGFGVRK